MKKTFCVFLTVVFYALAFAIHSEGHRINVVPVTPSTTTSSDEAPHTTATAEKTDKANAPTFGIQISQESINLATSRIPQVNKMAKAEGQGEVKEIVVDLWNEVYGIHALNDGGVYNAATNTLTFPGSAYMSNQVFTGVTEDANYGWYSVEGKAYRFSGTLASDGEATVYPCIVYQDGYDILIQSSVMVVLNEENGYTADFDFTAWGINKGYAIMVAFLIKDSSVETTITSTNNKFYYAYKTVMAQEWTSDNDLPGLGLSNLPSGERYIVTCEDGVTTLGLQYEYERLYVTGINTPATEVVLPDNVTIPGNDLPIYCLGDLSNDIDLSSALNLTTLNVSNVQVVGADFAGSSITDLYVRRNADLYNFPGNINVYLHVPYGTSRSDYSDYGFKRVLVGEEQSYYPETTYSEWVIAGENDGDYFGISLYNGYYCISEIFTDKEAVELPITTPAADDNYYIRYFGRYYEDMESLELLCQNAPALKSVTIPSSYTHLLYFWGYGNYDGQIKELHMLGDVPYTNWPLTRRMTVYVVNQAYYTNYLKNSSFNSANILPENWDFKWITVNVAKKGEFADTYLTENDYDWSIGKCVKVVGDINYTDLNAIRNLTSLMKLDLSETTITSLPSEFMYNRTSLFEVMLPTTLNSISYSAFYGCSSLMSVDLNGIKEIEMNAFYGCKSLAYINLTGVKSIESNAFYGCSSLIGIDLSTAEYIYRGAFYDCISLETINLASAISIGRLSNNSGSNGSFYGCYNLKSVSFGENLQYIGSNAFYGTGLTNVVIPAGVSSISSSAFENCFNLVSVELPSGLETIQESAFYGCASLEEITIPSTVTSIGTNAFGGTSIKNFRCYAAVPPTATASFMGYNTDMSRTFLHVPPFSKDFYRNTLYWNDFYLMRSIQDPIDYILVDRPLSINLEEEDNAVVANNPEIVLTTGSAYDYWNGNYTIEGQLTTTGEGTLPAGQLTISGTLSRRYNNHNSYQYMPTLITYAYKMRADNITHNISFYNYNNSGEWHFISLPYDVKVSDIVPSDNTYWVIRRYDSAARAAGETTSTWVNLTNDDVLEAGKGYIVSVTGGETYTDENGNTKTSNPRLTFTSGNSLTKNNLFRSTDIIVPLTEYASEFAHNRSWNLIGNPYPCYFDMHYLNEEFTAPITVWNGNSYVAYSPVDDDLVLSPYEAFFVQCPLDANEMIFKEAGRLHSNEGKTLYKGVSRSCEVIPAEGRNVFNFVLSGENCEDRARIVFNADAKMEYEIGCDASKFFAEESSAQIYVASDVNYSICERPVCDGCATLGLRAFEEKTYTLSLSGRYCSDWHVMVTDNVTGITVDLTESDYEFTAIAGDSDTRFSVKFELGNYSGIEGVIADFGNDANVTVTAINGATVYNGRLSEMTVPSAGLYIISDGQLTRKAILK